MPDRPITPTRVFPAGTALPPATPQPAEVPPRPTPPITPPAPAAAVPPPPEVVHRHVHEVVLVPAVPEPEPTWWDRALAAVRRIGRPWQAAAALAAAVAPILPGHYSAATTWAYVVHQTRLDHGAPAGYVLAAGVLAATVHLASRRPGLLRLWLAAVALVGASSAVAWWDPIAALTGVHR